MINRIHITAPLIASSIFLAIVVIVALVNLWGVLAAALGPGLGQNEATAQLQEFEQEHEAKLASYRAQFDGRSIFRTPNPTPKKREYTPPPPPPPPSNDEPEDKGPPQPEPPPPHYGGRSVLFVVGNEVWFDDGDEPFKVNVGETVNEHTIIEVNAPKFVKVGWRRGEYEVPIFENWDSSIGLSTTARPSRPVPGLIEAEAPQASAEGASVTIADLRGPSNTTTDNDVEPRTAPALSNDKKPASDKSEKGPPE